VTQPATTSGEPPETQPSDDIKDDIKGDSQKEVEALRQQLKEKDAKYVYLYADFENYKKRTARERSDLIKFGWEPVAKELLLVADNLERALAHLPAGGDKNLSEGLTMVLNHFHSVMEKQGVHNVSAKDTTFDPNVHEAVGQEPSEKPAGTVTQEHAKGYTLHGRLLRPARVIISSGSSS